MAEDADLREALFALGLPPSVLRKWLAARRAFCEAHGGRRHYAEVLDLLQECEGQGDGSC